MKGPNKEPKGITHVHIQIDLGELETNDPVINVSDLGKGYVIGNLLRVSSVSLNRLDGKRLLSIEGDVLVSKLGLIQERTEIFYPDCPYTIYYYGEITG